MSKIIDFFKKSQQYAKAIIAGAGAILVALSGLQTQLGINIIPADWQPYITFALAVITAYATWQIPNKPNIDTIAGQIDDPGAAAATLLSEENRRNGFHE